MLIPLVGLFLGQVITARTPLTSGIGIKTPGNRRVAIQVDPVLHRLVLGTGASPRYGDRAGREVWAPIQAGKDGWFTGGPAEGGYVDFLFDSAQPQIVLLHAEGSTTTYVNGLPRPGDPYQFGYVTMPVKLKAGENHFMFSCGRGRLRAWLEPAKAGVIVLKDDATLPDWRGAASAPTLLGAVLLTNCTEEDQVVTLEAVDPKSGSVTSSPVRIPALTVIKAPFTWRPSLAGSGQLQVKVKGSDSAVEFALRPRKSTETQRVTFMSAIDGSVQYYALNLAQKPSNTNGLVLSLHGASVEAIGQADAYGPHDDMSVVCPTNRRPYGFDWEDVGRLDALEVLQIAGNDLPHQTDKVYLTGHSMGGHGTWSIGSLYPDRFAALAPSAGWISFASYPSSGPTPKSAMDRLLVRASSPSDTLLRKQNLMQVPIYGVHGDADDNVPVTELQRMVIELAGHPNFATHIQKGAGHWWDVNPAPGADCVDWPGIFDLFHRSKLSDPATMKKFDFATPSPGVSSSCYWLSIVQQVAPYEVSKIRVDANRISTDNVKVMVIDVPRSPFAGKGQLDLNIDGQPLLLRGKGKAILVRNKLKWLELAGLKAGDKSPDRSGGFKDIFRNRFVFVYGTKGTREENEWAKNKARFDSETWWYRGNGTARIFSDQEFRPGAERDVNILLYGNAKTNFLWNSLFAGCPIQLSHAALTFGARKIERADLALLMIRPRAGGNVASVAGIGGTGIVGMRMCDRVPIFTSGAGMPDFLILSPETLEFGSEGWSAGGYFENDWSLDPAQIVYSSSAR